MSQSKSSERRSFLKHLAVAAGFAVASTTDIKIDENEGFVIGRSKFHLDHAAAHGECGADVNCSGGDGKCGLSTTCGGGSDDIADEGDGVCGDSMGCVGGAGTCGATMSCGGGGSEGGVGKPVCGGTLNCTGY